MTTPSRFVVFTLDSRRYALPVEDVERVVHAVEIIPLPDAPQITLGVFSLQGRVIPLMNLRQRFELQQREIEVDDQYIVAQAGGRSLALPVDQVVGISEVARDQVVSAESVLPESPLLRGVLRLPDGLVLIHNLARFLGLEEGRRLDSALAAARAR